MSNTDLLLIFTKNPVEGKVKTRLAHSIGNTQALDVYRRLLTITRDATVDLSCDKAVFYDHWIENDDIWHDTVYIKQKQRGAELGTRMHNAFQWAYDNHYRKVVIIGTDCPEITPDIIKQAFHILRSKQAVLGPASDGGYYLLGMKRMFGFLFRNKPWSTDKVKTETIHDLAQNHIDYGLLTELTDIDTEADLKKFQFLQAGL